MTGKLIGTIFHLWFPAATWLAQAWKAVWKWPPLLICLAVDGSPKSGKSGWGSALSLNQHWSALCFPGPKIFFSRRKITTFVGSVVTLWFFWGAPEEDFQYFHLWQMWKILRIFVGKCMSTLKSLNGTSTPLKFESDVTPNSHIWSRRYNWKHWKPIKFLVSELFFLGYISTKQSQLV